MQLAEEWMPVDRSPNSFCATSRSEEHTSELQSHSDLVCRLLLEKKKKKIKKRNILIISVHCLSARLPSLEELGQSDGCRMALEIRVRVELVVLGRCLIGRGSGCS